MLYLIYTLDLPRACRTYSENATTAKFAVDTAILAADEDPAIASTKLQENLNRIDERTK